MCVEKLPEKVSHFGCSIASLKNNLLLLAEQSMEEVVPPSVSHATGPYFSPLSLTLVRGG